MFSCRLPSFCSGISTLWKTKQVKKNPLHIRGKTLNFILGCCSFNQLSINILWYSYGDPVKINTTEKKNNKITCLNLQVFCSHVVINTHLLLPWYNNMEAIDVILIMRTVYCICKTLLISPLCASVKLQASNSCISANDHEVVILAEKSHSLLWVCHRSITFCAGRLLSLCNQQIRPLLTENRGRITPLCSPYSALYKHSHPGVK